MTLTWYLSVSVEARILIINKPLFYKYPMYAEDIAFTKTILKCVKSINSFFLFF